MWEMVSVVRKSWRHNRNHAAEKHSTERIDIELFHSLWVAEIIVLTTLSNKADLFRL